MPLVGVVVGSRSDESMVQDTLTVLDRTRGPERDVGDLGAPYA